MTCAITQARQDLYKIVDASIPTSIPVQISSKLGSAVLLSFSDWQAIQETIYLSSIPGFKDSLEQANEEEWFDEDKAEW